MTVMMRPAQAALAVDWKVLCACAGTADDRVKPSQTYKFVAQLQDTLMRGYNSAQRNPIVMDSLTGGGHIGNPFCAY